MFQIHRQAVLGRELTKINEGFKHGPLAGLLEGLPEENIKGECVIFIAGAEKG